MLATPPRNYSVGNADGEGWGGRPRNLSASDDERSQADESAVTDTDGADEPGSSDDE